MLYTKQLVSGKDINLKEHLLGVIKQPIIDDFMGDYELEEFTKVFYIEQTWKVNGVFENNNTPFTFFLLVAKESPEILLSLYMSIELLYGINKNNGSIELADFGDGIYKLKITKNNEIIAWIGDENFDYLSQVILNICYFDTPKPNEKEEEYETDDKAILAEFEKYKRKFQEKKQKDATQFEEIVREVIHMRKATYNDIKNMTVFQLQDTYKTYLYMEKDNREWMMMTNPLYQPDKKNNKTWMDETKIKRD